MIGLLHLLMGIGGLFVIRFSTHAAIRCIGYIASHVSHPVHYPM